MPNLTDQQKTDVRRHLGYGPMGDSTFVQQSFQSYRYFHTTGVLEYRLKGLSTTEVTTLVGNGNPSAPVSPSIKNSETGEVIQGYLAICDYLESQIAATVECLDTLKAGEWTARNNPTEKRAALYNYWCRKMANFLGLPLGPERLLAQSNYGMLVA